MTHDPEQVNDKKPPEEPVGEMDPDKGRGSDDLKPQQQKNKVDNPKDNPGVS